MCSYQSILFDLRLTNPDQVVELDHSYRERVHKYQLHSYMYGHKIDPPPGIASAIVGGEAVADLVLSPSSCVVKFEDLTIYRIGAGKQCFCTHQHVADLRDRSP
jgi:polyribonucleotide 5'-hydroxyl-kinase